MNTPTEVTTKALPSEVTLAPPPDGANAAGCPNEILKISPAPPVQPIQSPAVVIPPAPKPSLIRQNYTSLAELGSEMLEKLRKSKTSDHAYWDSLLTQREVTGYLTEIESRDISLQEAVSAIETAHQAADLTKRQRLLHYYTLAFLIADDKCLWVEDQQIADVAHLVAHMKRLLDASYSDLERFCHKMVSYDGVLDLQLEAWLISLGKQNELSEWRIRMTQ